MFEPLGTSYTELLRKLQVNGVPAQNSEIRELVVSDGS
jgi:hypothetical protein